MMIGEIITFAGVAIFLLGVAGKSWTGASKLVPNIGGKVLEYIFGGRKKSSRQKEADERAEETIGLFNRIKNGIKNIKKTRSKKKRKKMAKNLIKVINAYLGP